MAQHDAAVMVQAAGVGTTVRFCCRHEFDGSDILGARVLRPNQSGNSAHQDTCFL